MTDPITRLRAALESRYALAREIGEGGMATVYLAHDERHHRNVELKVLKPELAAVVGAERFLAVSCPPKAVPPSPKTSASASGASYRLCGVQTWGVLRFERPRTRVLRAQTGCFRSLYGSPGARFLTPGDTGAESARCAAGWAEAFGAVLSEAGSLDGTPDAEQSVDRGLPPDDP